MNRRVMLMALVMALVTSGCGSIIGAAGWERVVGVIDIGGPYAPPPIQLPEQIRAGVPFEATVVTWGSGSCNRADGYERRVLENGLEITPFDRVRVGPDVVCTDDLRAYGRTVPIRLDTAGEAIIRVVGETNHPRTPTTYEVRVVVSP